MSSRVLTEAKRLHALGFAIHWIKPKSKAPVKSGWTTGPRDPWAQLEKEYRPGFNVGVRLGKASLVRGLHLVCVDQDVKSSDPRHQAEMKARLKELLPTLPEVSARVTTGRGNGSAHTYLLTPDPVVPKLIVRSPDRVEVLIPSIKPSQDELRLLSPEKLKKGIRLRPAWEIALMGEGRQTVLPPSLHQDTGREYAWETPVEKLAKMSFVELSASQIVDAAVTAPLKEDFKVENVDLFLAELPADIVAGLETGEGVLDRSAFIFKAAIAMVREGLTDNQIATVLTDPESFIGKAAFEHAKTESRHRAAQWILKYTVRKARVETDARFQFDEEVKTETLTNEEAEAQATELLTPLDWRNQIERVAQGGNAGRPKNSFKNVVLILTNAVASNIFRHNDFTAQDVYGVSTPWGGRRGDEVADIDFIRMKAWFVARYGFEPTSDKLFEATAKIADDNKFHPVQEYILAQEWDGKSRINSWLKDFVNAKGPEPYLSDVSRKILLAMVARVFQPGIKFDHIPVLEGRQGVGKSSAARILASDEWFADNLPDLRHPDARLNLRGKWLVEIGELASLKRSDLETVKAFITSQSDRVRAPYGRKPFDLKRQTVFMGTTNEDIYLKDKTGNRRYWPVEVGQTDFKGLKSVRDQLFAEAYFVYSIGENLWLEGESRDQAEELQGSRVGEDVETVMVEKFEDFLIEDMKKPDAEKFHFSSFSVNDFFNNFGPFVEFKADMNHLLLATKILKSHGFEKFISSGRNRWRLVKPPTTYSTTYSPKVKNVPLDQ